MVVPTCIDVEIVTSSFDPRVAIIASIIAVLLISLRPFDIRAIDSPAKVTSRTTAVVDPHSVPTDRVFIKLKRHQYQ